MDTNTKVVVLVDLLEPIVAQGAIGTIIVADPQRDYYEVSFDDDRLFIMRGSQIRPATEEEIAADFAPSVATRNTGSLYPADYFLDEMNRLF